MATMRIPGADERPVDTTRSNVITLPPAKTPRVRRPRLVAAIETGIRGRLTIITAGAGWGKSSALADWAGATDATVAWFCAKSSVDSPVRFFRSLAVAFRNCESGGLDDVFTMLRSSVPLPADEIVRALLAELDGIGHDLVIVIDDLQVITDPQVHAALALLVNDLPSHIHLVLASRREMPFPVARLRGNGELVTIDQRDLAFTEDEALSLLEPLVPGLSRTEIAQLVRRTEGWGAGLTLAGVSLGRSTDRAGTISRLRGTQRDVADYLGEEVLGNLPEGMLTFLLHTSILDELNPDLCNAVAGCANAAEMLLQIETSNLFIIPMDEERTIYRYHGLFQDLLLAELRRIAPDLEAELNARAAQWYEDHAMIVEAVRHAMRAGDMDSAASLIDRTGEDLIFICGETELVVQMVERLPRAHVIANRNLSRLHAWALALAGRLDDAERLMSRLERDVAGGPTPWLQREHAAIRSRIAAYRNDSDATIALGEQALATIDDYLTCTLSAEIMLSIGFAHRALGHHENARRAFSETISLGRSASNVQAARWGMRYLAEEFVEDGRLRDARSLLDDELQGIAATGEHPGNTIVGLLIGLAEVDLERNDLASARASLDRAIPLIQHQGDAKMLLNAYTTLAMVSHAEGDASAADDYMRRAMRVLPGTPRTANVAWLALVQDRVDEARRWATGTPVAESASGGDAEFLIRTWIMVHVTRSDESFDQATRLLAGAESAGRAGRALDLHCILTAGRWLTNDHPAVRDHLARALAIAQPEGFVRRFLNQGEPMLAALRSIVRDPDSSLSPPLRAYAMSLIAAFGANTNGEGASAGSPLTERQQEILALIAAGRSNRDIAAALFISEGTVKAHVHQLFHRLMARNRTEVVANARELHLLRDLNPN